jgi:hypothetical protein
MVLNPGIMAWGVVLAPGEPLGYWYSIQAQGAGLQDIGRNVRRSILRYAFSNMPLGLNYAKIKGSSNQNPKNFIIIQEVCSGMRI